MTSIRIQVLHAGWWVCVLLLGLAALALLWRSRRAWAGRDWAARLAPRLKGAGLLLLLLMLLNPVMTGKTARKGANALVILVDGSQSMEANGGEVLRRAWQAAQQSPGSWLARLEEDFQVEKFVFSDQLRRWPETGLADFSGQRSDLAHALDQVKERYARRPLAGVLVFSDGLVTDGARGDVLDPGYRVFAVPCGPDRVLPDVGIRGVSTVATGFEDAPVSMTVSLRSEGLRGGKVVTTVRDEAGDVVARDEHAIGREVEEHVFEARFRPARSGVAAFQVEAALEDGSEEVTLANNRWVESIDRGKGPYRVLYVCGRPNWEHKFLSRALAPDPEVQLVGLVRVAKREPKFVWRGRRGETGNPLFRGFAGGSQEEEPGHDQPVLIRLNTENAEELRQGFPRERQELFGRYHAVVVDDLEADYFTAEQQLLLEKFVSLRGGSLLMLGGQESLERGGYPRSAIGQMLPVYLDHGAGEKAPESARLELTREGWLEPWVRLRGTEAEEEKRLALMPPFHSVHSLGAPKPGASILVMAAGEGQAKMPVLVSHAFGEGRVAALGLGEVWRWGMEDESQRVDLERWWRQVIRWLVADVPGFVEVETAWEDERLAMRSVRVRVRRADFRPEENATVELRLREPGPPVAGETAPEPVRLFAEPSLEEPGLYLARVPVTRPGACAVEAVATGEAGERLGQGEAGWSWNPAGVEWASLRSRPEWLEQIAARTGGRMLRGEELDGFARELPRMAMPVQETWVRPAWHQVWLLLLVLALIASEWALRRWKGQA